MSIWEDVLMWSTLVLGSCFTPSPFILTLSLSIVTIKFSLRRSSSRSLSHDWFSPTRSSLSNRLRSLSFSEVLRGHCDESGPVLFGDFLEILDRDWNASVPMFDLLTLCWRCSSEAFARKASIYSLTSLWFFDSTCRVKSWIRTIRVIFIMLFWSFYVNILQCPSRIFSFLVIIIPLFCSSSPSSKECDQFWYSLESVRRVLNYYRRHFHLSILFRIFIDGTFAFQAL